MNIGQYSTISRLIKDMHEKVNVCMSDVISTNIEEAFVAGYNNCLNDIRDALKGVDLYETTVWKPYNYGATSECQFQNHMAEGKLMTFDSAKSKAYVRLPSKNDVESLFHACTARYVFNIGYDGRTWNHRVIFCNGEKQISFFYERAEAKDHVCRFWLSDPCDSEGLAWICILRMKIDKIHPDYVGDDEGIILPPEFMKFAKGSEICTHYIIDPYNIPKEI